MALPDRYRQNMARIDKLCKSLPDNVSHWNGRFKIVDWSTMFKSHDIVRDPYQWQIWTTHSGIGRYKTDLLEVDKKKPHIPPWKKIPNLSTADAQKYEYFFGIYDKLFLPPKPTEISSRVYVKFLFEEWKRKLPIEIVEYIVSFMWRGEIFQYLRCKKLDTENENRIGY